VTRLLWVLSLAAALAQAPAPLPTPEPSTPAALAEPPAGPPVADPAAAAARATALAEGLRCPVCQGLSAAASQAESAVAMRARAEELVTLGYSDEQILAFFVSRYGEWVLLEPPRAGRHWLIWAAPVALLCLGALVVAWRMTAARQVLAPEAAAAGDDPYERRVLDELDRS
jgi:cytochrome c-type biogenesis protein CcmH